jgi:hypothetical protein
MEALSDEDFFMLRIADGIFAHNIMKTHRGLPSQ